MSWTTLALLSALFAGLTALLAKVGMEGVPSNLGTLARTIVVVLFAAGIVIARGEWRAVLNRLRKDLAVPGPLGRCDRAFLALLLRGFETRADLRGRAD